MARPTTKNDLIESSQKAYDKLSALLASLSEDDLKGPFNFDIEKEKGAHWRRDKNIRDVLIHLHEWHKLLLNWVDANQKGVDKQFLEEGYNWRTYGEMNVQFWERHQETSYEEAVKLLNESHVKVMQLAEIFTNEELFSKGEFKWVGGTTLGSYFVSTTSSHYDWAIKKIRKYKRSLQS